MAALREETNSTHSLRPKVLQGMAVIFVLVLAILVTMFLVTVISVG